MEAALGTEHGESAFGLPGTEVPKLLEENRRQRKRARALEAAGGYQAEERIDEHPFRRLDRSILDLPGRAEKWAGHDREEREPRERWRLHDERPNLLANRSRRVEHESIDMVVSQLVIEAPEKIVFVCRLPACEVANDEGVVLLGDEGQGAEVPDA